ncbi:hypothetical protein [Herbaspirillum rubrisubalbicans]|nr:hypothetical protein [Herbaspirillum rubrisubalbicans]
MSTLKRYASYPAGRAVLMRYISAFFLIGGVVATAMFIASTVAR